MFRRRNVFFMSTQYGRLLWKNRDAKKVNINLKNKIIILYGSFLIDPRTLYIRPFTRLRSSKVVTITSGWDVLAWKKVIKIKQKIVQEYVVIFTTKKKIFEFVRFSGKKKRSINGSFWIDQHRQVLVLGEKFQKKKLWNLSQYL